jgi:hypothetical protein
LIGVRVLRLIKKWLKCPWSCAGRATPRQRCAALHCLREIMGKLKLTVNEDKTRICSVPEGEFDFLGYFFGRRYSPMTGRARLAVIEELRARLQHAGKRNICISDQRHLT